MRPLAPRLLVLFDIDGTLISTSGSGRLAMDAALAEVFGVRVPIAQGSISGRTDRKIAHDQFQLHQIPDTEDNWQRFIDAYLRHLPDSLKRNEGRVLPGIGRLLQELAGLEEMALGLLTGNHRQGAKLKLAHFGIDHYFAFGAFGDVLHDRDHVAAEAVSIAARELGTSVAPERTWVIGDTLWDIRCAQAIGAQSVGVATGFTPVAELAAAGANLALENLEDASPLWRFWREQLKK